MFDLLKPHMYDDDTSADPAPDPAAAALEKITAQFTESLERLQKQPVAPVADAAPSAGPSVKELAERQAAALKDYQDKCATGDYAGAMSSYMQSLHELQASQPTQSIEKSPAFKVVVQTGRKLAKLEHPDDFKKWGTEIEATHAALSVDDRMSPDAWEIAREKVRQLHFDDIVRESVEAEVATRRGLAPQNDVIRSKSKDGKPVELTKEQAGIADSLGISHERYALSAKTYTDAKAVNPTVGVDLLGAATPRVLNIAPGRF